VVLGVTLLKGNISQSRFVGTSARNLEHFCGSIHADRLAFHRDTGGLTRRLSCPATDIEHTVTYSNGGGGTQMPIVPL
jgi:hypothetical protein